MDSKQNDPAEASAAPFADPEKQEFDFPGASYAKSLFDRHQVASSERSRLVNRVLELAYSASHRRVKGQFDWTFGELETVARHFGESLDEALIAASTSSAVPATMMVAGDSHLPCQLWIGREMSSTSKSAVAAVNDGTTWLVGPVALLPDGPRFEVKRVLVEPNEPRARIAVLDDQPSITAALCQFMSASGFAADPFHSIAALQDALATQSYDAYVLDWVIGNETVGALIQQLRNAGCKSPIAILTGKATERGEVVSDIADLVAKHDVRYFSKPLDPHMITAVLSRLIPRS